MFPSFPESFDLTPAELADIDHLISNAFGRALAPHVGRMPHTLYHYTTPTGFHGIVSSSVLRATHIAYTNDSRELLHAVKLLRERIDPLLGVAVGAVRAMLVDMAAGLDATTEFNTMPIAIACFCEDGDLLSQWRGYGAGEGGIAIGFESAALAGLARSVPPSYLAPVIYEPSTQTAFVDALLKDIVSEYAKLVGSHPTPGPRLQADFLTILGAKTTGLAALFKDNGFASEKEWRLVRNITKTGELNFSPRATHLAPTVDIEFPRRESGHSLPIAELCFGPGRYQAHAFHSCGALLTHHGYLSTPVQMSKTPFRSIS